jgi:hypothetical protein
VIYLLGLWLPGTSVVHRLPGPAALSQLRVLSLLGLQRRSVQFSLQVSLAVEYSG